MDLNFEASILIFESINQVKMKPVTVFPRIVSAETILFLKLALCTVTFGDST